MSGQQLATTPDTRIWRIVGNPLVTATGDGPLTGAKVAVKDVFAVAGHRVGAGIPRYEELAEVADTHADAVAALLAAGASVTGIARTDQFAYAMTGDNPHYGTPPNGAAPESLPGGSSSGPASAVAAGAVDIGLATDTAGSIRVPASYQDIWGLRTTHGSLSTSGLLPLAPDFDTVGLLTRTPSELERAASVLCAHTPTVSIGLSVATPADLTDVDLDAAADAFRIHQGFQAWQSHGEWITAHPGAIVGATADRFRVAAQITAADDARARATLAMVAATLADILGDGLLVLPSASSPPPLRSATPAIIDRVRADTMRLTCIAGITGRPVVAAPHRITPDGPVGRSVVGPPGSDLALITAATALD